MEGFRRRGRRRLIPSNEIGPRWDQMNAVDIPAMLAALPDVNAVMSAMDLTGPELVIVATSTTMGPLVCGGATPAKLSLDACVRHSSTSLGMFSSLKHQLREISHQNGSTYTGKSKVFFSVMAGKRNSSRPSFSIHSSSKLSRNNAMNHSAW